MSYGIGCRCGLDPALRLAATASIGPLAWELPCAVSAALEKTKKNEAVTVHCLNP